MIQNILSKILSTLLMIMAAAFLQVPVIAATITTTPAIAEEPSHILYVAQNKPNAFATIQSAIDNSSRFKSAIILIAPGIYKEKLFITRNNLSLIGSSASNTSIEFAELRSNWRASHNSDWGAAVINIAGSDINIINLSVINHYGRQHQTSEHQFAIRGFENATRIILHQCQVIADGADTLSLWNKSDGMYYHSYCLFEGYTDMVCPRGSALIENSRFFNHKQSATLWHDGELDPKQKLVVTNSQFDGTKNFWLARHHYDAQFYFINNQFSANMADKVIFKKTYKNSERNQANNYGERYFFYHNQSARSLPWLSDNFTPNKSPLLNQSVEQWVFNNAWAPKASLKRVQADLKKTSFVFDEFTIR